jgi:hypothetical protein
MPSTQRVRNDLDVSIGPHPAREDWRTLRVNCDARVPEQKARVAAAIRSLYTTQPPQQEQAGGPRE